jgi:uncharacterized hydrophobic protein (TIGR00271 family)
VLRFRLYAAPEQADAIHTGLAPMPGVRHLVAGGRTSGGLVELSGDVDNEAADAVLGLLHDHQLGPEDLILSRVARVQALGWRRHGLLGRHVLVWAEMLGRAREHARPGLVYLLYMVAAGVIAGVGVLTGSSILIVGAMALSPDLLPISAIAIGLVERRRALWSMALLTLLAGLAVVVVAAAATTLVLRAFGRIDSRLDLSATVLGQSFTSVGPGTLLVALAAGMAGMLAYETAGSAAVGVAISVTTIPATAYSGVAAALAGYRDAGAGLTVLATNVVGIVIASAATVWTQRRWSQRRGRRADDARAARG